MGAGTVVVSAALVPVPNGASPCRHLSGLGDTAASLRMQLRSRDYVSDGIAHRRPQGCWRGRPGSAIRSSQRPNAHSDAPRRVSCQRAESEARVRETFVQFDRCSMWRARFLVGQSPGRLISVLGADPRPKARSCLRTPAARQDRSLPYFSGAASSGRYRTATDPGPLS
jgi:hypothetical protein